MRGQKAEDSIGKKYNKLTIRKVKREKNKTIAICDCECGTKNFQTCLNSVRQGTTTSCGCNKKQFKAADLTGQRFGMLIARKRSEKSRSGYKWECDCDCGGKAEVLAAFLLQEKTASCGCLARESGRKNIVKGIMVIAERYLKDGTNLYNIQDEKPLQGNPSGYRNITITKNGTYRVVLYYKKKRYDMGIFCNLDEAVKIRDIARKARIDDRLEEIYMDIRNYSPRR